MGVGPYSSGIHLHSKLVEFCSAVWLMLKHLWHHKTIKLFLLVAAWARWYWVIHKRYICFATRSFTGSCCALLSYALSAGGKGAYAAIDAVGGEMTKQLAYALRDGGTVYVYGALSGDPIQMDTLDTLYKYKRVEVQTHA